MTNKNLNAAKKAKNDEFWTLMPDIEKEVSQYKDQFEDKVIYCNCDDYRWSNFYKYFKNHFKEYKLKRLIASCLTGEYASYDGNVETTGKLQNGDFRKEESIELLKQADIVVTNPPFSLFREYIAQLIKYKKKFLIIGNQTAIACKEIFPLIKEHKIWLGNRKMSPWEFQIPDSATEWKRMDDDGKKYATLGSVCWFTNLPVKRFNEKITLVKTYNPKDYPKYDNYDAIEVSKVCEIPKDYDGIMGVPITFLYSYCLNQFEIVGLTSSSKECTYGLLLSENQSTRAKINSKYIYARLLIKKKNENNTNKNISFKILGITKSWDESEITESLRTDKKNRSEPLINGKYKYTRLLIKKWF